MLAPLMLPAIVALLFAPAAGAATGAPTGLTAPTPTKVKPVLSWTAPVSTGAGIAGYNVYRGVTKLNSSPTTATIYTDTTATANNTITYTVKAVETGTAIETASGPFTVVYDTAAPAAPTALAATTPTNAAPALSWTAAAADPLSGFKQYDVYRAGVLIGTTTTTSYVDTSVVTAASYAYTVKTEDNAGNLSAAAAKTVVFDNIAPATPAGFAPAGAQRTKPTLSWTAATDGGGSGLGHYEVYLQGAPTVDLGGTTATSFVDAAVTLEGSYAYYVIAVDKAGNTSAPTAVKTVLYDVTPPTVPGAPAASASPTAAKPSLGFTASSDTGGSGVTSYRLYRNGTSVATTAGTTVTDSGLATDGSYSYYVTALDAAGNESAPSSQVTVLYDKTAPPVATGLTTGPSPTSAKPTLSWASGGVDNLSGFLRFDVYRGAALAGSTSGTTFTDTTLSSSGAQVYTIKTVDAAGNVSAGSAPKTVIYDVLAPSVPGNVAAPAATKVKPTITWTASTDTGGAGLASYRIYRDGTLLGTATTTSYNETSSTYPDAAYAYTVSAVDNAGNESPQLPPRTVVYDTTAPGPPGDPVASPAVTKNKPAVTYAAASDPGGSGIASYRIYRDGTSAGTSVGLSFQDTALATNGTPIYTVVATDAAGNTSAATAGVAVVYDTAAPPKPTGLAGVTPTGTKPVLTWTSGGPDTLSGFDHYEVYRSGTTLIGSPVSATFTDTLAASGSNSYTVKAVDLAGNTSAASTAVAIVYDTTPPPQPTALTAPTPTGLPVLSWTKPTDVSGINQYWIYRNGSVAGSTTATTFTDTPAPAEGTYSYTVAAVDNAGNTGLPSSPFTVVVDSTPPPAPTSLTGSSPTSAKPVLTWASGGADTGSGFLRYVVTRNGSQVATPAGATFSDAALTSNGTYTYTVAAADVAGNVSAPTAPLTIVWDNVAPPTPTGLGGGAIVTTTPHLTWFTGGPDGLSGFDHYAILRGGVAIGTSVAATYDDTSITSDGSYDYTVKAVDLAGNLSAPSTKFTVIRDTAAPSVPQVTAAVTPVRSQPSLTWAASTDGGGSGVATYRVLRDGVAIFTTSATSYTDDAALSDGLYLYTVAATDRAGNDSAASLAAAIRVDTVAPPAPSGLTAPTPTNLPHLTWTQASDASTGGSGIGVYRLYRNGVRVATSAVADTTDAGVLLDDVYDYTVTAVDGAGNESLPSAIATVLFDHTPPPAPAGLLAPTPSQARPALTWSFGGNDALSGFDHYAVYRDGNLIGTPTGPAFTDSALSVNGSYLYTVRAVDAAGNLSTATGSGAVVWDTTAPQVPGNVAATSPAAQPVVTWSAASDSGGATLKEYAIYRDGAPVATTTATIWTDTDGSAPEGIHAYAVQAVDRALNASAISDPVAATIDRTAPAIPAGVAAATPTARPVITWTASTDGGAVPSGVARYDIYRGVTLAGTTTALVFSDDLVTADSTYAYTVVVVDRAGNASAASTAAIVTFDTTPPPTPVRVAASSPTPASPALTWNTGGTDNLSGFDHYEVLRDGNLLSTTTAPAFNDTTLAAQGAHDYTVRAVDVAGNASPLTPATTVIFDTTPPPAPTGLGVATPTNLPRLAWDAGADDDTGASGLDHYVIYRDGSVAGTSSTTGFADSSVQAEGSYGYAITAVDRAGNESLASRTVIVRVDQTPPPAPGDPSAITPTRSPVLQWTASSDAGTGGSTIVSYRVYRDGTYLGETTGTSYSDIHPGDSGHHLYTVRVLDAAGNMSPASYPVDVVVDNDGPALDSITFPAERPVGAAVTFSVYAHDALTSLQGEATWDFGDGSATGNRVTHIFTAPGTYAVTVRASDVLGNVTLVANRSIDIVIPPGGIPPSVLTLRPIRDQPLRRLKLKREVIISVTSDVHTRVEIILERRGALISDVVREIAPGGVRLVVRVPRNEVRAGRYRLTVRATNTNLQARKTFAVK